MGAGRRNLAGRPSRLSWPLLRACSCIEGCEGCSTQGLHLGHSFFCANGDWKLLLSVVRIWHRCITEHGRDGHQKPRALRYFFWSHLPFLSHSPGEIVVLQHQLGWEGDDKRPRLGALPHKLCGCCFCACGQAGPFLMGVILLLPSRPSWALLGLCLPRAVPTCLHPCSVCIAGRAAVCEVSSKPTCLNQTPWCTGNCW